MGLLVEIEHAARVDAQRAARVCRALGFERVFVDGLRPPDRAELDHLLAQLIPDSDTTVSFARGVLALDLLEALALAPDKAAYTDVKATDANVRVWPTRAWVHTWTLPPGGVAEAAAIVGAALGIMVPAVAGTHIVAGGATVTLVGPHLAIDVATKDRAAAVRLFRALADTVLIQGIVMMPGRSGLERLPAFLHAIDATVTIDAHLPLETAAALVGRVPCDRWQVDDLQFLPDSGVLSTHRVAPVLAEHVSEWTQRIDGALASAG